MLKVYRPNRDSHYHSIDNFFSEPVSWPLIREHYEMSGALIQSTGEGFRLAPNLMLQEFERSGPLMHLLLRYTQRLITRTAACNCHLTRSAIVQMVVKPESSGSRTN